MTLLEASEAATAADKAYHDALVAWVGKKRAGDARYLPREKQPAHVAALGDAFVAACEVWRMAREEAPRKALAALRGVS